MGKWNVFGKSVLFAISSLAWSWSSYASSGITYQGRLLKPNGEPVTSSNVQFRLQIRTPGTQDCLLYEELQTQDLSATRGVFAISLGDGTGLRQDSNPWGLFDALSNRKDFTFNAADCTSGVNNYSPDPTDNRKFRVLFNDGASGWEALPLQTINFIPMSIESYAIGGFPASSLLRVEDAGTLGDVDPITTTQYDEIIDLVNGTSSLYGKPGELGGSALPSLGAGQAIVSDGSGGWQAATPLTSESDPTVEAFAKASLPTCSAGEILTSDGTSLSCVTDSGGWSAQDATDTVKGIVVVPTGGGLEVSGGAIGLPDQALTPGSFTKVTVDQKGRVTSGASLVESDIPTLSTAGKVSGDAITSGTIGGTTAINTSGNIETSGTLRATGVSTRQIVLYDSDDSNYIQFLTPATGDLTSDYTLRFPTSLGSANQVLGMNSSGTALENKSITAGAGVTINHTAGGIEITASGSGGTVTNVSGTSPISVANGTTTPTISLDDSGVTANTYGSATEVPVFTVDSKGRITGVTDTAITGVSPVGSSLNQNQVYIGDSGGQAEARYFSVADLRNASGTQQIQTCTSSQTLIWSSITDTLSCTNISITTSQISNFPSLGTAASEDVGTGAGDVVQLDGSGRVPASLLPSGGYDTTYFKNGGNSFGSSATLGLDENYSLHFETGAVSRMTIDSSGRIGIGTTTPSALLTVGDPAKGIDTSVTTFLLTDNNPGASAAVFERAYPNDGNTERSVLKLVRSNDGGAGASGIGGYLTFVNESSTEGVLAHTAQISGVLSDATASSQNGSLIFSTTTSGTLSEKMRIDAAGNIGIGAANPLSTLDIRNGGFANITLESSDNTVGTAIDLYTQRTYPNEQIGSANPSGGNKAWRLTGHGSANPSRPDDFEISQWDGGSWYRRFNITSDGNVGIGTTVPQAKLDVNGGIKLGSSAACGSAQEGTQRYNSTSKKMEYCNGTSWVSLGGGSVVFQCTTVSNYDSNVSYPSTVVATCAAGYTVTGGGCYMGDLEPKVIWNSSFTTNGFECGARNEDGSAISSVGAFARCCRLN